MKIRNKLIISFLAFAFLSAVPLYFSLQAYNGINLGFSRLMSDPVPTIKELENLRFAGIRIVSSVSEYGFVRNETDKGERHEMEVDELGLIESGYSNFDESLARYQSLVDLNSTESQYVQPIKDAGAQLKRSSRELVGMKERGISGEEIIEKKEAFELEETAYLNAVDRALSYEYEELQNEQHLVGATITTATAKSLFVSAIIFLAAALMGLMISRRIASRLSALREVADKIGAGELDVQADAETSDELGKLAQSFTGMAAKLKTSRNELVSSRNFVDNILGSMADALFVVNPQLQISRVNQAACALTGRNADELMLADFHLLNGPDGILKPAEFAELSNKGTLSGVDGVCVSKNGDKIPVATSGSAIVGTDGELDGFVFVVQDITKRKKLEEQLTHLALHDPLTGLANRVLFRDRLEHALHFGGRNKESLTVLYLDVDDFKTINDSPGHTAGDTLLKQIAERIKVALRPSDTIARLGGDEFAILIERAPKGYTGTLVAERIETELKKAFLVGGKEIFVTVSTGIAVPSTADETPENLLRNADVAMYIAKRESKGNYVAFESKMHAEILKRIEIEADLRSAVKNEEFFLHYHPIVDLESGTVRGMETLVRWRHPKHGVIPPLDFIPVAESTGVIIEIGRWILRQACRQGRVWYEDFFKDRPFSLMVNLSPREFQDEKLTEAVESALVESGLPPHCLVLEITESMMMLNTEAMIDKLSRLKNLGVRLAIDDFGTGYSSLSYIERFPIDILKIDKSFTDRLSGKSENSALAKAIISMSESLNLESIAEGIEKPEQIDALIALGCAFGQGFHFSKPLDEANMNAFLRGEMNLPCFNIVPAGLPEQVALAQ